MSAQLHITIMLVSGLLVPYAAARRGPRLAIIIDATLSHRAQKLAWITAMTDEEYEAFESQLPVAEQKRRLDLTWEWRHLSRRAAMIEHLRQFTDESYLQYEAELPLAERMRRNVLRSRVARDWEQAQDRALV